MADKEIGLIQIRNGKQRNLPIALEHAELAFTTDDCRMFIGLPSTVTPASLVAGRRKNTGGTFIVPGSGEENVEILTEFTPSHVINRVLTQAQRVTLPLKSSSTIELTSVDRAFLDYVAYDAVTPTNSIVEHGRIDATAIVLLNGALPTSFSQINNTTSPDGIPKVACTAVSNPAGNIILTVQNDHTTNLTLEFTFKGWNNSI